MNGVAAAAASPGRNPHVRARLLHWVLPCLSTYMLFSAWAHADGHALVQSPQLAQHDAATSSSTARTQGGAEISAAETLLFLSDHWSVIRRPTSLRYSYRKSGGPEPGFDDTAQVDVMPGAADGKPSATLHFLTGKRKWAGGAGALEGAAAAGLQGNPVLLGFLERDIAQMSRLTGGSPNYFRKRIRLALAESAQMRLLAVSYGTRHAAAQEVRIQPYLNDPMRQRFEQLSDKSYVFVLSEELPGAVYQLRTLYSGGSGKSGLDRNPVEETLTLVSDGPLKR
jgi:hypothetical protein